VTPPLILEDLPGWPSLLRKFQGEAIGSDLRASHWTDWAAYQAVTEYLAGIGGFFPLRVGTQSVTFLDVLANVNFADYPGYSSIINTTVAGGTISTSTRLGQRWLNGDRSWMYGVNFGYDSRPMATGPADTGVNVSNSQTVFFQQLALNAEAVSDKWSALGYWLMPIGQYGWGSNTVPALNSVYVGDSLNTIGGDIAYNITPEVKLSLGYYYQDGDLNTADSSGVKTRLGYTIANGVTVGFTYSYDAAFQSVATGDIKWRFGNKGYGSPKKQKPPVIPVIQALTTTPANRDVRVHDVLLCGEILNMSTPEGRAQCAAFQAAQNAVRIVQTVSSGVMDIVKFF